MKKIFSFFLALMAVMTVSATTFTKVTSAPADWSGQYLIVYEQSATQGYVFSGVDAASNYVAATVANGVIEADNLSDKVVTIAAMEGGYSVQVGAQYMGGTSGQNGCAFNANAILNTLSMNNDTVLLTSNTSVMRFNAASNNLRFRYFKATTYSMQKGIHLYKLTDGEVTPIEPVKPDTIGVTQALARIANNQLQPCYVKGVVATDPTDPGTYGNTIVWLTDIENPLDSLEGYKIAGYDNARIESIDDIPFVKGDTVLFYASALLHYAASNIDEINGGYLAEILGAAERAPKHDLAIVAGEAEFDEDDVMVLSLLDAENNAVLSFAYQMVGHASIAGSYVINDDDLLSFVYDGAEVAVEGTVELTFANAPANSAYVYKVVVELADADGVVYSFKGEIAIAGVDENELPIVFSADNTNVDVAKAIQICQATGQTATEEVYHVYGYVIAITDDGFDQFKNMTFTMSDKANDAVGLFTAFRVSVTEKVKVGDYVCVSGNLVNYKGNTPENVQAGSSAVILDPNDAPDMQHGEAEEVEVISADRAYEIGMALNNNISGQSVATDKTYMVIGYCVSLSGAATDFETYHNQTFYMANVENVKGNLQVYRGTPDREVAVGDKVAVVGRISNYCGTSTKEGHEGELYNNIQISNGAVVHTEDAIPDDAQAIPEVMMEESHVKAVKVLDNGQLFILRNGVKYNVQGAVLK